MKRTISILATLVLLIGLTVPATAKALGYYGFPTFSIVSVAKDSTVTIQTYNFPAGDTFTVTMGPYGGLGVGGIVVDSTASGSGGAFTKTYTIPAGLAGSYQIAIRLQSPTTGFYAYNWFYNNTAPVVVTPAPTPTPGPTPVPVPAYTGFPYFFITAVSQNNTVTISGYNFPASDTFTVSMSTYGTLGLGGTAVATTLSGTGGNLTATYTIPAWLVGSTRIAIRLQSPTSGFFAYNWFWNFNAP